MKKTGNAYGVINFFQGINATKALSHVFSKKGMHIKSCYVSKDKAHTKRYQELQN